MPVIRQLESTAIVALEDTTDALLTEIKNAEVMPFDTGNLQNENTFVDYSNSANGVTKIVSSTPYARRLYFNPETVSVRGYVVKKGVRKGQEVQRYTATKMVFSREEHIAAGDKWLIPWLKGGTRQNFCSDTFAKIYRRLNNL